MAMEVVHPLPVEEILVDEEALVHDETEALKTITLANFIQNHGKGVVMISKTTCPFCLELKRTLQTFGVHYTVVEADKTGKIGSICKEMQTMYSMSSFPILIIDGEKVGGCTDCKTFEFSGQFQAKLAAYITKDVPAEKRHPCFTTLHFPETVNNWVVRSTGTLSMIYAVLCTAFWNHRVTKWAVLAIAIDYTLRIIFGGTASPIGMIGSALVAHIPPNFVAGPPKQFAACCGWFMTALSAALYLSGEPIGGAVMIALLIPPAAMEGLLDFCLGCWMFGLAIDFGIVPASVYRPYLNSFASKAWAWNYAHDYSVKYPEIKNDHVLLPGQTQKTPADLIRKERFENEYKNQDVSVRHVTVDFYAAPLAFAALALVFKLLADGSRAPVTGNRVGHWGTRPVFQAIGIASVALCGLISIAYIVKACLWFKKIQKEWNHPVYGNFFSAFAMCITLYGVLLFNKGPTWAISLVWIGSGAQMAMTVLRISDLIYGRIGPDMITPALMMAPVGNFISAIAFGTYDDVQGAITLKGNINYLFVGRLWFSVAVVFGIVLFTITFQKAILDHHTDPRMRPTLFIWMAACAVAGPAYLAISYDKATVVRDVFYQTLWLFSVFLCAVNGVGYIRGFHTYVQDTSIWMPAFAFCALSINTIQYYYSVDDKFTQILAIISVVIACTTVSVCAGHTLTWIVDLSLFKPRNKWGPASFMKLTHEMFRFAVPKLNGELDNLLHTTSPSPDAVALFISHLDDFFLTYHEHGQHEEKVLFPQVRRFFPQLNPTMDEEHEYEHSVLEPMIEAIKVWKQGNRKDSSAISTLLGAIGPTFPSWSTHLLNHLRNEEQTATVVIRKYTTLEQQKDLANHCWNVTSIEDWARIIPYTIRNLPVPMWKVRFIKTFIWASPDRAQQIGLICYRGLDSVDWAFLSEEIPEIIPRGLPGWKRIH